MTNIPTFQNFEDETRYHELFDEKLAEYKYVLDKVKDELYGKGFGNYSNLPGTCFQIVYNITNNLIYETTSRFEEEFPEYKVTSNPSSENQLNFTLGEK